MNYLFTIVFVIECMERFRTEFGLQLFESVSTITTFYGFLMLILSLPQIWEFNEATFWMFVFMSVGGVVPMVVVSVTNGVRYVTDVCSINRFDLGLVGLYVFGVVMIAVVAILEVYVEGYTVGGMEFNATFGITTVSVVLLVCVVIGRFLHTSFTGVKRLVVESE